MYTILIDKDGSVMSGLSFFCIKLNLLDLSVRFVLTF